MIPSIPYLLAGHRTLSVCREHAADLLNLCRIHGLIYENFQNTEDGGISLRFPRPVAKQAETLCREHGIPVAVCGEGGLPHLLLRLGHRAGLIVGAVLGLLLLVVAQSVVWDIRISGNEGVSDHAIRETLAVCGFSVGTPLRGFEADKLENRVLLSDDRLAWISVNRKGTVAYVEVREKRPKPTAESNSPCDIVASVGGVIQRVELEEGNVRVSAGQIVGEGEVLVSGLYDSMQEGIRFTAAKAKVYARTAREIVVQIPLTYEQKVYQTETDPAGGAICQEKILNFFGNYIKFKKKTGNIPEFCDIIEDEKSWALADGVGFPISVCTVWYMPYTVTTATRTLAEAEELAYFELAKQIAALPGGAELISKTVSVHHGTEALTLTCMLTCIEDIGRVRPIEIAN